MKIVVTAMGNPDLHEQLEKEKEIKILGKDIQYQEGIFEIIEKEKKIDIIIINELISGKLEIKELIKKIKNINKKIKIILLLEKPKKEIEKEIKKLGIKILYLNEINKNTLLEFIENKKSKKEIEPLKLYMEKNKKEENNNVIAILGTGGIGKSVFISNLSKIIEYKKILILDLDILNNSIQQLFKVEQYKNILEKNIILKKEKIEDYIIKVNEKIDILAGIYILLNKNINTIKIEKIIHDLAKKYDVVFIDTTLECFFNKNKKIIETSNFALFLVEGNMLEIKKAKNLLEIYVEEWKIKPEKIKIIMNKYTNYSIDTSILKNIFKKNELIGKLNYFSEYQIITEKNILFNKKIKKEYKKISDVIYKKLEKNIKNTYV